MELSEPAIVTPNDELIAAHSENAGAAVDPFFTNVKSELYDKGFLVATADKPHCLGAHRLADVDAVRTCLLRDRDDADGDAAL